MSYSEKKINARSKVIEIYNSISEKSISYAEMTKIQDYAYVIAKRYGLLKEFKNEGIL